MHEAYKILLVEDDVVDCMAFQRFVRAENLPYQYTIANSIAQARVLLAAHHFDVALMDYSLGDGTSLQLFDEAQHLPIIVITGASDLQIAVDVMRAGAYDFLTKDHEGNYLTALPITVKNTVQRWRAQQELALYRFHLEKVIEERTTAWMEDELRLRTILESTPIVVFSLDPQANFTFIAGHTHTMMGKAPEDIVGKSFYSLIPAEADAQPGFQSLLTTGTFTHDVEMNGHWLSISATAHREDGVITGVTGVVQDITERKYAELGVVRERNLLRTLIDNIPDYIFIKDQQGRFIETNRAHAAGANLSREKLMNRTAREVFDASVSEQFHADDTYVLSNGKSIINEERMTTTADGSRRWVLTTKVPLYDDTHTTVIGLVGISRDITDRRKAEEEKLQAEKLRLEIEQQRELVEMKERFIATATHDFRTPLTIIRMTAYTLEDGPISSEKQTRKLQQIHSQVDRMVRLLDDVLIVSKTSAEKASFSPHQFDLKAFCEMIWEDMCEVDQQKHISHFEYQAGVQQITADKDLLQHALVNLLSNALKYTPANGEIRFQVSSDDSFVTFQIRDTGCGISEADQKHLFEPFYRALNTKHIEGTGLGLVIVKAYLDLHGGTVAVQSAEGVGTTFIVRIPCHQDTLNGQR